MRSDLEIDLVRDFARSVVTRVAPAEIPAFRAISEVYFDRPDRVWSRLDGCGLLDFGPGDLATLLTPAVLASTAAVLQHLLNKAAEDAVTRARAPAIRAVRKLFGRGDKRDSGMTTTSAHELLRTLTTNEWTEVRRIAIGVARRHGISDDEATRIADAIVALGHDTNDQDPT